MQNQSLWVEKTNIFMTQVSVESVTSLDDGDVLMEVDKFALTSNNITYAVIGFQLKYWNFFPVNDPYGIVPVWGFGTVVESKNDEIKKGDRFYGYFPMSQYLKVTPGKVSKYSFSDMAAHRQQMAPIYNNYLRLSEGNSFDSKIEDYIPIFRPLFATSFLNYHYLLTDKFYDAENLIITSASSKTALGLAHMFKVNKAEHGLKVIGLTSSGNMDFVKSTDYYDEVMEYRQVTSELEKKPTTFVDMAGNAQLLLTVYRHLDDKLKFISKIGLTDWTAASMEESVPVAKFFFAPAFAEVYFKEHGVEKANAMINAEMLNFIKNAQKWISIHHLKTFPSLKETYIEMVNGKVDPSKGYVFLNE